jgi:Tfp pilus assembly protein FimT
MDRLRRQRSLGLTMPEALTALAIILVLATIAIPIVRSRYVGNATASTFAEQLGRDLRRARVLAVLNSATSPNGCGLQVTSAVGGRWYAYRTVDLSSLAVVPPARRFPAASAGLQCASSANVRRIEFSPTGSARVYDDLGQPVSVDPLATVSAADGTYDIRLTEATGFVEVQHVP